MLRISDCAKYYNVGKDTIVRFLRLFPQYGEVVDSLSFKLNDNQMALLDEYFKDDRLLLRNAHNIKFRHKKGSKTIYKSHSNASNMDVVFGEFASDIKKALETVDREDINRQILYDNRVFSANISRFKITQDTISIILDGVNFVTANSSGCTYSAKRRNKQSKLFNFKVDFKKKSLLFVDDSIFKILRRENTQKIKTKIKRIRTANTKLIKEERERNISVSNKELDIKSKPICIDNIEFKDGYYFVWSENYLTNRETSISPLKVKDDCSSEYFNYMKKYFSIRFPQGISIEYNDDHVLKIIPEIQIKEFISLLQSHINTKGDWWYEIHKCNLQRRKQRSLNYNQNQLKEDISFRTPYLDYLCGLQDDSSIVKAYEINSNEEDACIFTISSAKGVYVVFENISVYARATEVFATDNTQNTISYVFDYFASEDIENKREKIRRKMIDEKAFFCRQYFSVDHDSFELWKGKLNNILLKGEVNHCEISFREGLRIPAKEHTRLIGKHTAIVNDFHNILVAKLYNMLVSTYKAENVGTEIGIGNKRIDVVVKNGSCYDIYEVKTYDSDTECVREAIGQIMEYAYYNNSSQIGKLVIVGPATISEQTKEYLKKLRDEHNINIHYMEICI